MAIPTETAPAVPSGISQIGSAFADLERLSQNPSPNPDATEEPAAGEKTTETVETGTQTDAGTEETQSQTTPAKTGTGTSTKPTQNPPAAAANGKPRARDLRGALDQSRRETAEWKQRYESLKTESEKPRENPREKQLEERIQSLQQELEKYESDMRFTNYERSRDYLERYQQPFENAYLEGAKEVQSFTFREPGPLDDITGEPGPGTSRKATQQDWDKFLMLGPEEANQFAHEHFAHNAPELIAMRREVIKLARAKAAALEDFRKNGAERLKSQTESQAKSEAAFKNGYQKAVQEAMADPELSRYFKAEEGDTEGRQLLEKGFALADSAFADTSKLPPEERAALYAAIRNRAGAFSYLKHNMAKLAAQVEELEQKLSEYEGSEPGHEGQRRNGSAAPEPSGMEAFEARARKVAGIG